MSGTVQFMKEYKNGICFGSLNYKTNIYKWYGAKLS